jgi:hypothetical protein
LTAIVFGTAIANLLFYAVWHGWEGGWCWGPRLLIPSIIMIHTLLPECIKNLRGNRTRTGILAACCAIGIPINLLGSLVWYQEIYYFQQDLSTVRFSHPVLAARLLLHKMENKPEIYPLKDFGLGDRSAAYEKIFAPAVHDGLFDFRGFEKFRGFSTMWSGVAKNFHIRFLWIIPLALLLAAAAGYRRLWNCAPLGGCGRGAMPDGSP